ncbi:MAG: hypothetical protein JXQ83_08250, partial [Candidatus Glassbacteria bacterium]|nr:hypothetical protein [Candidatus Glassbacteria bacterium]
MWVEPLKLLKNIFGGIFPRSGRKQLLSRLERILGYSFKDARLLETALSHRSCVSDDGRGEAVSNERLEFLGDSVLDMLVSEYLYRDFPAAAEGELTRKKSAIVSRS